MTIALKDLISREVAEMPEGVTKSFVFEGAQVIHLDSMQVVEIRGPVDLSAHGALLMAFTSPVTGETLTRPGITLIVCEEDGQPVHKPLNIISKRLIAQLAPDLADGSYLKQRYTILATDAPPKTRYSITRTPL
jgi:hypothetical protein